MDNITFSDILIEPQYSEIESRKNVDISSNMGKFLLQLPVISANMPQITGWKMAVEMYKNGGMGILHRFCSIEDNVEEFTKAYRGIDEYISVKNSSDAYITGSFNKINPSFCLGVSIGIKEEDKKRCEELYKAGARIITIDIASGHCKAMKETIEWLRKTYGDEICIIAGNIATPQGAVDLVKWGASICKVGVGGGKVCRTRSFVGVGVSQFGAIKAIKERFFKENINNTIISDGGIKTSGDVCKSLIYADAVMCGAVLASTSETPSPTYPEPNTDLTNRTYYKLYGGSASMESKVSNSNGKEVRFVEGETIKVPFKGKCKYILREIADSIASCFSYSNSNNLQEFKQNVKWNVISSGSQRESKF